MRYFVKSFEKENVTLTGYIHDVSNELKNAQIRPAVLIFPGGGYFMCSDREAEPVALAYMAEGYQAFVLRYSVGEKVPFSQSYEDACTALAYLKENSDELHVDAKKIAIAGFSAGGHLAAALGTMGKDKPTAMILGYPVILSSMGDGICKEIPGLDEKVTAETPPAFIFSTSNDIIVPVENSLKFAEALNKNGVEFELHIFRNGVHGLSLAKPLTSNGERSMVNPVVAEWFTDSVRWLKEIWGDFYADHTSELEMTVNGAGIDTPVKLLLQSEGCEAILTEHIPNIRVMLKENPMAGEFSLRIMNHYSPEIITGDMLEEMERKLAALQ